MIIPQAAIDLLARNAHATACVFGENHSSVVFLLETRKCIQTLMQSNDELARALSDALSTFRHDDKPTVITAERQEAWAAVLQAHRLPP